MNTIIRYMSCLLGAAAFVACSSSNTDDPDVPRGTELSFTVEVSTRATLPVKTELGSGDELNVYMSTKRLPDATSTCSKGVCAGSVWKGEPALTLESGETYLYAVYPYVASATDPSAIPVSVEAQVDYLYSGTSPVFSTANPTGLLSMKHAMAAAAFNMLKAGYSGAGQLQRIRIGGANFPVAGTMNVATGKIVATQTGEASVTCSKALLDEGWRNDLPTLFVIPFASSGSDATVTFTIDDRDYTCNLPEISLLGNRKYIFRLALTENGVTLFADQTQTVSLTDDEDDIRGLAYGAVRLLVGGTQVTIPAFSGAATIYGSIYWGDDTQEDFAAGASHTYPDEGPHAVTVETWGASRVSLPNLKGVEEIDLSEF